MSPEVEVRIMIRDGTAEVGGVAAETGLPAPEAGMGGDESAELGAAAVPSPVEGTGAELATDAPSPTTVGMVEGVAASGELPSPVPLEEIEQLAGGSSGAGMSNLPEPEGEAG